MTEEIMDDELKAEEIELDQYLVFTVKDQEFGFQARRVQEILSVTGTTKVPNAPSHIEGIMNLRGRLATVINFRKKFGFEQIEHDEDTRIIIVEQSGFPIGIVVDAVEEVIKIPDDSVHELPKSARVPGSEECITGVGMLKNRLIILLDIDRVLTGQELIEAGAISQMMEKVIKGRKSGAEEETNIEGA